MDQKLFLPLFLVWNQRTKYYTVVVAKRSKNHSSHFIWFGNSKKEEKTAMANYRFKKTCIPLYLVWKQQNKKRKLLWLTIDKKKSSPFIWFGNSEKKESKNFLWLTIDKKNRSSQFTGFGNSEI